MKRTLVLAATLCGCDDTIWGPEGDAVIAIEGYAGVQAIADASCLSCHSADAALGQLDLETDLHNATVDVPSQYSPYVIVAPGSPQDSMLYLKVTSQTPSGSGTEMPPGAGLDADNAKIIEDWILDGAPAQ